MLSGHDVSDGGLITTILEMCFGGVIGVDVDVLHKQGDPVPILFAEEVGWVLEVDSSHVEDVVEAFKDQNVPFYRIGHTVGFGMDSKVFHFSPFVIAI